MDSMNHRIYQSGASCPILVPKMDLDSCQIRLTPRILGSYSLKPMNYIAPPWTRHTGTIIELALLDNKSARKGRLSLALSNKEYATTYASVHINLGTLSGNTHYATRRWLEGAVLVVEKRDFKNSLVDRFPQGDHKLLFSFSDWAHPERMLALALPSSSLIIFDRGSEALKTFPKDAIYWPSEGSRDHTYLFLG